MGTQSSKYIFHTIKIAYMHDLEPITPGPRCPCMLGRKMHASPAALEDRSETDHLHTTDGVDRCYVFLPDLR